MATKTSWFEVDKDGLSKLVERRGKAFVVYELLQNAWDCDQVTRVAVTLEPVENRPLAHLVVEDDYPDGFKDLTHSYTVFAPSEKKVDPRRRGRFNLGEKLVLALCETATITSTTGSVTFDDGGRHRGRKKTSSGTRFEADVCMTRDELADVLVAVERVISPSHVETRLNGRVLFTSTRLKVIRGVTLQTDVADAEGYLRRRYRDTDVEVYALRPGEKAMLYEMGIPVMEMGDDPYRLNVMQKVPLSMERDAVAPSYLKDLRGAVLDSMHDVITPEGMRGKWASEAVEESVVPDAVRSLVEKRYGAKVVVHDPSDPEANNIATSRGYTVIAGGSFTAEAWDKVRGAKAALPAGQVTPSPKPFHPDGSPLRVLPPDECTPEMVEFASTAVILAWEADALDLMVVFASDREWAFKAAYERASLGGGILTVNVSLLGQSFFQHENLWKQVELLVHELGHHHGHHLDVNYYQALCRLAGKMVVLALSRPKVFGGGV